MGDKALSDVIEWGKHIEPYRIIEIVSGVGSGKNYWVENTLMKEHKVLLITSRKKKVEETKNRKGLNTSLNLSLAAADALCHFFEGEREHVSQCICNNWQIEFYVKNTYDPNDESTHLWNCFDVIVLDEAHSMATDATFADAPFHTWAFLQEAYEKSQAKIIMMTATPAPIDDLVDKQNPDYKFWDFTNECRSVVPKEIQVKTAAEALEQILAAYKNNFERNDTRILYFVNTLARMEKLVEQLSALGIAEPHIAISHSKKESGDFSDSIKEGKKETEQYLPENENIPPEKFILVSTTKNKEGINIEGDKKSWLVFTESHYPDEIKQMWGRIRNGLQTVTIVCDANQHSSISCTDEVEYLASKHGISGAESILEEWCAIHKSQLPNKNSWRKHTKFISKTIGDIENVFPFIRYSYFKEKFVLYNGRITGVKSFHYGKQAYKDFVETKLNLTEKALITPVFGVDLHFSIGAKLYYGYEEGRREFIIMQLAHYIARNKLTEKGSMGEKEEQDFLDFTYKIGLRSKSGGRYKNLSSAISSYGYTLVSENHKKKTRKHIELGGR